MKNYFAPEMKVVSFLPEENVAANAPAAQSEGAGSNIYNDAEFGAW